MKPETRLSHHHDVKRLAIIGGGIASVCLVHELFKIKPDISIDIYCKDTQIANGASGNKQGAIYPLLQGGSNVIAQLHDAAFHYALNFYQQWPAAETGFHQTGVLQQAMTDVLQKRYQQISVHWPKTAKYVCATTSSHIAGIELPYPSLWFKSGGWLAPGQFCLYLLTLLAKKHQINLHFQSKIDQLTTQPTTVNQQTQQWQLLSAGRTIEKKYDAVAVCAGFEAGQFSQTNTVAIEPIRGQVSHLGQSTPLNQLKTVVSHKGYITPATDSYQCFGATFDRNNTNTALRQQDIGTNLAQIKGVYPTQSWATSLSTADVVSNRACIRANTADRMPIVGEVYPNKWVLANIDKNTGQFVRKNKVQTCSKLDTDGYQTNPNAGLYTLAGLGARGLTTAPLMAMHLANLILTNRSPLTNELAAAVSPMRFQIRYLKRNKDNIEQLWT